MRQRVRSVLLSFFTVFVPLAPAFSCVDIAQVAATSPKKKERAIEVADGQVSSRAPYASADMSIWRVQSVVLIRSRAECVPDILFWVLTWGLAV